jgi:Ribosomal silencing factor during starvation
MLASRPSEPLPLTVTSADSNVSAPFSEAASSAVSLDPIPWYLQVDTPQPPGPSHPFADRQLIPNLPHNPPLILPPMLEYLSVDTGLDDLTLLDLRSLDPPPALGANLLMIIGTARSVKHLNVSADRFCRWLRSNYKLRPYADGLLGRNELKLKLRRKARRAKLAASVGNTMYEKSGGADDGITTGWICVNVGQVEDGLVENAAEQGDTVAEQGIKEEQDEDIVMKEQDEDVANKEPDDEAMAEANITQDMRDEAAAQSSTEQEEEEYLNPDASADDQDDEDDGYIGFGSRSNAPRIVVQMFIEEKRAELDLEGLWQDRSSRRTRKAHIANDDAEAAMEEQRLDGLESDAMRSGRQGGRPRRPRRIRADNAEV